MRLHSRLEKKNSPGSLLWRLRADPRIDAYVEEQLGPLLQAGQQGQADLDLLRHVLDAGGSMTRLAAATGANRPGCG